MISLRGLAALSTVSTKRRPNEPVPPVTRMTLPSRSRREGANRPKSGSEAEDVAPVMAPARKEGANHVSAKWGDGSPPPPRPRQPGRAGPAGRARRGEEEEVGRRELPAVRHADRHHHQGQRPPR